MLPVVLRAADAYTLAAHPLPKPVTAGQRKPGVLGPIVGFTIMFAAAALVILSRIAAYTVTHSYQPMLEPLRRLFG